MSSATHLLFPCCSSHPIQVEKENSNCSSVFVNAITSLVTGIILGVGVALAIYFSQGVVVQSTLVGTSVAIATGLILYVFLRCRLGKESPPSQAQITSKENPYRIRTQQEELVSEQKTASKVQLSNNQGLSSKTQSKKLTAKQGTSQACVNPVSKPRIKTKARINVPSSSTTQPVQSQPVQSQPVQSQPVQSQPVQSQPVQSQPAQSQSLQKGLLDWVNQAPTNDEKSYREIAFNSIMDCHVNGIKKLSLFGNLTSLPPEIGQLTQLRELELRNNNLASLPPEIGQLTQLQELELHNNNLTSLPPEIGQLKELRSLDLSENKLALLPLEISQLIKLEYLKINNSCLTFFPPGICNLINLRELYIQGSDVANNINGLIDSSALDALQNSPVYQSVFQGVIMSLPPEIGRLTRLRRLHLPRQGLSYLPPEISNLKNLFELDLSYNRLGSIPNAILKFPSTTAPNLASNRLSEEEITNLKQTMSANGYVGPRIYFV